MRKGALLRGDVVEVRNAGEILATLDGEGALGAMAFMPEMIQYLGRRFTVSARADKRSAILSESHLRAGR
jgi:hypothetical protein